MNLFALLLAAAMATPAPHAHSMMHSSAMHGKMTHANKMHGKMHTMKSHPMMTKPTPKP
jgi:hypothetical protein